MRRLFIGNFDFEYHLAERGQSVPAAVARLNAELACAWTAVAADGDGLWLPEAPDPEFFESLIERGLPSVVAVNEATISEWAAGEPAELCPWGWTERLRSWAVQQHLAGASPSPAAVRKANSRRFSFALEREWQVGLLGAAELHSVDELPRCIANLPGGNEAWVIKAEFSMSARERILGRGKPSDAAVHWLRKRLATDGIAFFEPWVERIDEAGLQFTIPPSGEPILEGVTPLLTDGSGGYRGSRFSLGSEVPSEWQSAVDVGRRAAARLQAAGYFGPLGIDAMRYREANGCEQVRPLQDVNARFTMGRLSVGWRRLLEPGQSGAWLHVRWPGDSPEAIRNWCRQFAERLPSGSRLIRTSPLTMDGKPVGHGTVLAITDAPFTLPPKLT